MMTLSLDFEHVGHLLWRVSAQPQLGGSGELAVPGGQQVITVPCRKGGLYITSLLSVTALFNGMSCASNIIFTFVSKLFLMVAHVKGLLKVSRYQSTFTATASKCLLAKVVISDSVTVHSKENSSRT